MEPPAAPSYAVSSAVEHFPKERVSIAPQRYTPIRYTPIDPGSPLRSAMRLCILVRVSLGASPVRTSPPGRVTKMQREV